MNLPDLITALSDPSAYPYPVKTVEVRQTHISAVFIAGPCVYKVKKPVNPGFLDFSTLQKREHFCHEEVRLNRRLAPHVYLGVVPIVETAQGVRLEAPGESIEWAVKMIRLPDDATLQERLRRGEVTPELVADLARRLASFHRLADTSDRIADCGRFESVSRILLDVYTRAAPGVGTTVSESVFSRVKELTEQSLARLRSLIERRAAEGRTRDCHGDLHLDHVYYFPGQEPPADLVIIDCIEFNEGFRFIDPVSDMAFAAMDFAFHGRRDLARAFADAYFLAAGDPACRPSVLDEGRSLLPLYTAHRATVRGTVEGLLLTEKEVPEAERAAARGRARAHWLLALAELEEPGHRPCLLLVAGLPGAGKSSLSRVLAERASFCVIRSDVVRKELAGLSDPTQSPPPAGEGLYTAAWNERTYAECLRRAEQLLFEGKRVLVDATFREEKNRRAFLDAAVHCGVPFGMLVCQAEPETVRRRLAARHGDVSDADWAVYLQLAATWEEARVVPGWLRYVLSTEETPEQALAEAVEALRQWGL
jgi:aminoglycoside phosphotransferase family enzyme/predicted kinase